ncbi:MAG: hypothetical protein Q7S09_03395 [bacterium]|nr:hypothetical protein [bacterium]
MKSPESKPEKNPMEMLADRLDVLQAKKNEGRGVSCIRTLIVYLRRGDIDSARAVCLNESDKIKSYQDIKEILERELVKEDF